MLPGGENEIEAVACSEVWAHPSGASFPTHRPVCPKAGSGDGVDPVARAGSNPKSAITSFD